MIEFRMQELVLLTAYAKAAAEGMDPISQDFDQKTSEISRQIFGTADYAYSPVSAAAMHAAFSIAGIIDIDFHLTDKGEKALADLETFFAPPENALRPSA